MPQTASAKKALRQSKTRTLRNRRFKLRLKNRTKEFLAKPSPKLLRELFSLLDKATKLNIFHQNKSARLKSSFSQKLKAKTPVKATTKRPAAKTSPKTSTKKTPPKKTTSSAKSKPKTKAKMS